MLSAGSGGSGGARHGRLGLLTGNALLCTDPQMHLAATSLSSGAASGAGASGSTGVRSQALAGSLRSSPGMGRHGRKHGGTVSPAVQRAQAAIAAAAGGSSGGGGGGLSIEVKGARTLQSLWAGYGEVRASVRRSWSEQPRRVGEAALVSCGFPATTPRRSLSPPCTAGPQVIEASTDDQDAPAVIIKEVAPPPGSGVSHLRKLRSYKVGGWRRPLLQPVCQPASKQRASPCTTCTESPC